jgi:hypothetical protein
MSEITIRYAESDADVIAIHAFLCIVAGPRLPAEIDPKDSATEVWRVAHQEVAIMAMREDKLIGTIGLVCPSFWWNSKVKFLVNRWAFAIPGAGAWKPLLREARQIGVSSNMEVHIISEERGSILILNKHANREQPNPHFAPFPVAEQIGARATAH